jgi:orotidine-5'-phosphate decarboxylase
MKKQSRDFLALALDNLDDLAAIRQLVESTAPHIGVFKIGLEQFTRFGPVILDVVRAADRKIFLDLKFHDIPNTVAKAVNAAAQLEVDFLTIHAQGGKAMMEAACDAAAKALHPPTIVAVTLLTSLDASALKNELKCEAPVAQYVRHLAELAAQSGLGGIVCSAADLPSVKPGLPGAFEFITPGIRLADDGVQDQKRVATPQSAIAAGATLLVVGRPITAAPSPRDAAAEMAGAVEKSFESKLHSEIPNSQSKYPR